jgi:hypothetical protein
MKQSSGSADRRQGVRETHEKVIPRVGLLSRSVVRSAIQRIEEQHGLATADDAFQALLQASQRHNLKLRAVAAGVVTADPYDAPPRPSVASPGVSFSKRANIPQPNRTDVVQDLMRTVRALARSDQAAVQLRDPVQGGLTIEGQSGFDRAFVDFFSYVDDAGTASGSTLSCRHQVFVDDVETSSIYAYQDRITVLGAGVRSVLSTPLIDQFGITRGAVTVHFAQAHRRPPQAVLREIQQLADDCATWLAWYEDTVMPGVLASVRAAARSAATDTYQHRRAT